MGYKVDPDVQLDAVNTVYFRHSLKTTDTFIPIFPLWRLTQQLHIIYNPKKQSREKFSPLFKASHQNYQKRFLLSPHSHGGENKSGGCKVGSGALCDVTKGPLCQRPRSTFLAFRL